MSLLHGLKLIVRHVDIDVNHELYRQLGVIDRVPAIGVVLGREWRTSAQTEDAHIFFTQDMVRSHIRQQRGIICNNTAIN